MAKNPRLNFRVGRQINNPRNCHAIRVPKCLPIADEVINGLVNFAAGELENLVPAGDRKKHAGTGSDIGAEAAFFLGKDGTKPIGDLFKLNLSTITEPNTKDVIMSRLTTTLETLGVKKSDLAKEAEQ